VFTAFDAITAALAVVLAFLLAAIGIRAWRRSRISPDEKERRRRMRLLAMGKMGQANLLDVRDNLLFYSYAVYGVEYTASQDISELKQFLPEDVTALAGHVYVRYDPRNPANSIILAEEWSGLPLSGRPPSR
jgi:hypothetical protein